MNMIFLKLILVLLLYKSPKLCESAEAGREEPLDFRNPIDLGIDRRQNQSPTKDNWSVDGGPTLVLYDDSRDILRHKEGVDDQSNTRQPKRVVFRDDTFDQRSRYSPYYIDIERQREIDRRKHSGIIPGRISLNLGNLVNSRIKKEREDEIRREINRAIDRKEHFLEDIVFQKRMGWSSNRQRPSDQRNHLPNNAFANRVGTFDSALERTEMERRDRLSQIERERSRTTKRNIPRPHRGPIREGFRGQREDAFSKRIEEEKLKNIEDRRTSEILNDKRSGIIRGVELMNRPYGHKLKPPILIYEEVPVPVKVHDDYRSKEYDTIEDYDRGSVYYMDRRPGRPSAEDESHDVTYVEDGIFVDDIPVSISSGPISPVDPTLEANIALANDFVTAVELEKLNQAATIADINTLHQLQLQQAAALATINEINQATLHNQIHDASILASASAVGEAATSQAILSQQIVDTVSVEEELANAQKVDFINLVLKHGLRRALKEQLKIHLRNKNEEEAFVHSLQVTRDDLIKRLILLKPYFSSPTTGGFILPAFIPNIPVGQDYTTDDLDHLPQIHLLPTTTLLDPNFRIPAEILGDLKNEVDITFVEYILRLPEPVFLKVIHLSKKDFILTLFPTVYRETMIDYKYDPVKHYHPNLPHKGIVKEHHHHHHIHTPPSVEKVKILEHPKPPFKGGYPKYEVSKDEHHIHHVTPPPPNYYPEPGAVPIPDIPFEQVVSQLVPESHKEVHIIRHPAHPEHHAYPAHPAHPAHPVRPDKPPFVGHFDHPRLTIPHGGISYEEPRLPLDKSSYVVYQGEDLKYPEESISFHQREPGFPPLISPHPVKGINIRFKGGKRPDIIYPTGLPTNNFNEYIEGRNGDSRIPNSKEKFGSQKVTKNKFENIINLMEVDNNIQASTSIPLELDEINPSTISPKLIAVNDDPNDAINGLGTTTSAPQISTFTNVPISVTTISSFDALNINPALSTSNSVPDDKDKEDQAANFNSEIESSFAETSTFSPPISTFSPLHKPFRGFSGNIRQMPFVERLKENTEGESNLNSIPGSDANDDDHVLSFFQKKKGNVTDTVQENNNRSNNFTQTNSAEEIVSKVKRITNIFGTRLQETIPEIHVRESNMSSSRFNPFFPGRASDADDIIKPSTQIDISSNDLRPLVHRNQVRSQIRSHTIDNQQETGNAIFAVIHPQDSLKKRPVPRRIDFTKHIGFDFQEPHHSTRGSHRSAPEASEHQANDVSSKTGTFAGIQINGLESLPHHLRTPPPCSVTPSGNRSFCIYPENYDSKIATDIVQRYGNAIEELKTILEQIPKPRPDLKEASKQLPHLNLSVTCEVEVRHVKLSWSRDVLGSWLSILQTEPFEQGSVVSTCSDNARINGCRPLLQPRPFIAFHPSDVTPKPYIMEFPLPVGCVYAIP